MRMTSSEAPPTPELGSDAQGAAGTQSLARAIKLIRALAMRGEIGWRLSDLATACSIDKGTAHRMLSAMVKERLVQQRPRDRRYLPGPLLFELALSLPGQHEFQVAASAELSGWAHRMNADALLLLRSGTEYVCSVCVGATQLAGLMIVQGTRRPLFTSVGGVAILQSLPPQEAAEILANNVVQEVTKRGEARLRVLQSMRERSARHGFGVNLGDVVPGLHAFAIALHGPDHKPFAALCLVGTAKNFPERDLMRIKAELDAQARSLEGLAAKLLFRANADDT